MKLPLEFTGNYWLFMVKSSTLRLWVRKSGESGGNLDSNDQSRSGRSVTTTRFKQAYSFRTYKKKLSTNFSDRRCRIKHWFGSCPWDYCRFGLCQTTHYYCHFSGDSELPVWSCSTSSLQTGFGTIWLWVVFRSQETSHNLKIIHFTCDEVQPATEKCFREESEDSYSDVFENTCSALASFHRTGGRLRGKMKFRNKLHILSYKLRSFSFWYLAWEYRYRCGRITFRTSVTQWSCEQLWYTSLTKYTMGDLSHSSNWTTCCAPQGTWFCPWQEQETPPEYSPALVPPSGGLFS